MRRATTWISTVLALGLAACAHGHSMNPANVQRVGAAQADVRAAKQAGADADPRARQHLALAERQIAEAQRLDDQAEAGRVLVRAELDAELALAIAREANLRRQAEETRTRISEIRIRNGQVQEVTP